MGYFDKSYRGYLSKNVTYSGKNVGIKRIHIRHFFMDLLLFALADGLLLTIKRGK